MPLLSVITAAFKPNRNYLLEAWNSLLNSRGLNEWEWEWCLQEDGAEPIARDWLPDDARITYGANMAHGGAAATRNVALARVRGSWVMNLDCDDFLTLDGMAALIETWSSHPGVIWAAGRAHDFIENEARTVEYPNYLPDGVVTSAMFMNAWKQYDVLPVHFAGGAMNANVMRALGGYFAAPVGEDVALWLAALHVGDGVYTSTPVFSYRRWDGQSTKGATYLNWSRADMVSQRVDAMRAIGFVR
jgi:glycosyltransferase involved in cell wall biosynthesis